MFVLDMGHTTSLGGPSARWADGAGEQFTNYTLSVSSKHTQVVTAKLGSVGVSNRVELGLLDWPKCMPTGHGGTTSVCSNVVQLGVAQSSSICRVFPFLAVFLAWKLPWKSPLRYRAIVSPLYIRWAGFPEVRN